MSGRGPMFEGTLFDQAGQTAFRQRETRLRDAQKPLDLNAAGTHFAGVAERLSNTSTYIRRDFVAAEALPQDSLADEAAGLAQCLNALRAGDVADIAEALAALAGGPDFKTVIEAFADSLGYDPRQVAWFTGEWQKAGPGILMPFHALPADLEWSNLTKAFSASHSEPLRWGFIHLPTAEVDPLLNSFVTTCRLAGVTASIYLLLIWAFVLLQGHAQAALAAA